MFLHCLTLDDVYQYGSDGVPGFVELTWPTSEAQHGISLKSQRSDDETALPTLDYVRWWGRKGRRLSE